MLPRLRAEEILTGAQTTALGSGTLGKDTAAQLSRRLEGEAGITRPGPSIDKLAGMGVSIEVVEKNG